MRVCTEKPPEAVYRRTFTVAKLGEVLSFWVWMFKCLGFLKYILKILLVDQERAKLFSVTRGWLLFVFSNLPALLGSEFACWAWSRGGTLEAREPALARPQEPFLPLFSGVCPPPLKLALEPRADGGRLSPLREGQADCWQQASGRESGELQKMLETFCLHMASWTQSKAWTTCLPRLSLGPGVGASEG